MRTQLVTIPTDTNPLEGAFHEPDAGKAAGAVLLFHGNTMNFYVGAARFLPPVLTRLGLACLAFNRRGHDVLSTRNSRIVEGGASAGRESGTERLFAMDRFDELHARAKELVAAGRGREDHVADIVASWLAGKLDLRKA